MPDVCLESGGVVYARDGKTFKSMDTIYAFNEAKHVGGSVMLENMDRALIQYDDFLNGTAMLSGMFDPAPPVY